MIAGPDFSHASGLVEGGNDEEHRWGWLGALLRHTQAVVRLMRLGVAIPDRKSQLPEPWQAINLRQPGHANRGSRTL